MFYIDTEEFIVQANKSLMSEFKCLRFHEVNKVMKDCYLKLGQDFCEIENIMAEFCTTETIEGPSQANQEELPKS